MSLIRRENFDSGYAGGQDFPRPFLFMPGQKIGRLTSIFGIQRSEREFIDFGSA